MVTHPVVTKTPLPQPTPIKKKEVPEEKNEEPPQEVIREEVRENVLQTKKEDTIKKDSHGGVPFSFPTLIKSLLESHPALTTDLKTARFALDGTKLTLIFAKKWNYDRVNVAKMKNIIAEVSSTLFGGEWEIHCELKEGSAPNIHEGVF